MNEEIIEKKNESRSEESATEKKSSKENLILDWGFSLDSIIREDETKKNIEVAEIKYEPTKEKKIQSCIEMSVHPDKKEPPNYTTLLISGGSIKGFLALGVLQYAKDHHYLDKVKTYIGTSIGAAIGYLLAIGYTPREILVYLCVNHVGDEFKYYNLVKVLNGEGSFSFDLLQKHMEKLTLEKFGRYLTLGEMCQRYGKKLIFCTYNLTKGEPEYLSSENYPELPCLVAVKMSANLPWVFEKFRYMGSTYIDGGIVDNFPLHLANVPGEKTMAINMLPNAGGFPQDLEQNFSDYTHHLIFVPMLQLIKNQAARKPESCDIIEIIHKDGRLFDLSVDHKEKLNLFSKGYRQARIFFERL